MMSQKSNDYFIKRFTKQENEVHKMSEKKLGQLKAIYREARKELETDLAFFIERYATKNEFDAADLQRMLNITEKAKFRYTIKGYVKEIERLGIDTKEAKALKKELDIMAGRTRVSRKQELLTGINYVLGKAGIKSTDVIKNHLIGVVDYVSKDTSAILGNSLSKFDPKLIERIVNQKWNSENYSDRVWKNRTGLARKVMKNITVGISQGHEFKRMSEKLSKDMNVGYYEARRIIETETTGALENAKKQVYKEMGITKYRFIATIDDRTSKICRALNGKVFDLKDRQIGVNCPFMHPFCRSVTVPVVDREALEKKKQEIREREKKSFEKNNKSSRMEKTEVVKTPLTLEKFKGYSKKWKNEVIDKILTEEEQNLLRKKIKNVEENSAFLMRYKSQYFEKLVETDRFMNLFETGISGGVPNIEARMKASKNLFGHNLDKESFVYSEKYGYLSSKDFLKDIDFFSKRHGTSQYGDIIISFNKGKIKDRITYTLDDSLLAGATKAVVPGDFNKNLSLGIDKYNSKKYYGILKNLSESNDAISLTKAIKKENGFFRYIELQYHGDITLDDVNEICFTKDLPKEDIIKILKDKNIKLFRLEDEKIVEIF